MSAEALKDAWLAVAKTGRSIIPAPLRANPSVEDYHAFCNDLDLLERRVVNVLFEAYADTAMQALGVPRDDVESFLAVVSDAINDLRGAVLTVAEQLEEQRVA